VEARRARAEATGRAADTGAVLQRLQSTAPIPESWRDTTEPAPKAKETASPLLRVRERFEREREKQAAEEQQFRAQAAAVDRMTPAAQANLLRRLRAGEIINLTSLEGQH
jgi:uncharacterized protein YcgI (DUF1989 family)